MILIDGKEVNWNNFSKNFMEKINKPHTWTIPPGDIKYDFCNNRFQVPDLFLPTEYHSRFQYGQDQKKMAHHVQFSRARVPYPGQIGQSLNSPQFLSIVGGYEENVVNNEINLFYWFAPWREDGVAYEQGKVKLCYLYNAARVLEKAETDAEIIMKVLNQIMKLSNEQVVAMARHLGKSAGQKSGVFVNDSILTNDNPDNRELKIQHIISLKNGLFKFAQKNPHELRNLLKEKDAAIFEIYERAMSIELIRLDRDKLQPGYQGIWKIKDEDGDKEFCPVADNIRPIEALVNFLAIPKNEIHLKELEDKLLAEEKKINDNLVTA